MVCFVPDHTGHALEIIAGCLIFQGSAVASQMHNAARYPVNDCIDQSSKMPTVIALQTISRDIHEQHASAAVVDQLPPIRRQAEHAQPSPLECENIAEPLL